MAMGGTNYGGWFNQTGGAPKTGGGGSSWIAPAIIAGGTLAAGWAANRSQRKQQEEALAAQSEENALNRGLTEEQSLRNTAAGESMADPWRHTQNQMSTMGRMDAIANYQPRTLEVPGALAGYAPTMRGGMQVSPEMRAWATQGRNAVAGGGGRAPTMTDPANYGQTGGLNYTGGEAGTGGATDLAGGGAPGAAGVDTPTAEGVQDPFADDYFGGYARREEGAGGFLTGAAGGAAMAGGPAAMIGGPWGWAALGAGATAGAVVGAFTKNAKTAATDVSIADAKAIVTEMYRREVGREPEPHEVNDAIMGTGWKPDHKWVGQEGLMGILNALRNNVRADANA